MSKAKKQQKMARINVDPKAWTALRIEALHRRISLADYIGQLVGREADRLARRNAKDAGARDPDPGPRDQTDGKIQNQAVEASNGPHLPVGGPRDGGHWEPPTDLDDDVDGLPLDPDWSRYRFDPPDGEPIQIPPVGRVTRAGSEVIACQTAPATPGVTTKFRPLDTSWPTRPERR